MKQDVQIVLGIEINKAHFEGDSIESLENRMNETGICKEWVDHIREEVRGGKVIDGGQPNSKLFFNDNQWSYEFDGDTIPLHNQIEVDSAIISIAIDFGDAEIAVESVMTLKDSNSFTCYVCKETFEKGRSDEEAIEESRKIFGTKPVEELEVLCDDCFKKLDL